MSQAGSGAVRQELLAPIKKMRSPASIPFSRIVKTHRLPVLHKLMSYSSIVRSMLLILKVGSESMPEKRNWAALAIEIEPRSIAVKI